LVVWVLACGASAQRLGPPEVTTTVAEIIAAYKANGIAADARYKNRVAAIRGGIVTRIDREILGRPYVTLTVDGERDLEYVQAVFPRGTDALLVKVTKGDRLDVKCRIGGYLLMSIQASDCEIIP
jgi:hypothetical protein